MGRLHIVAVFVVATLSTTVGCHKRFSGAVTQPNPLKAPVDTLRISEKVTIVTGDMELKIPRNQDGFALTQSGRYPLKNVANFTVVSRDRLRFHVQLEHKWPEYAEVTNWKAVLIDDQGRMYRPETVEKRLHKHVVRMWDFEQRSVRRSHGTRGKIVAINDDGHLRRQHMGNLSVFRGKADFVFYHHDIFTPRIKSMTLLVGRSGLSFSFTWRFADKQQPGLPPSIIKVKSLGLRHSDFFGSWLTAAR